MSAQISILVYEIAVAVEQMGQGVASCCSMGVAVFPAFAAAPCPEPKHAAPTREVLHAICLSVPGKLCFLGLLVLYQFLPADSPPHQPQEIHSILYLAASGTRRLGAVELAEL